MTEGLDYLDQWESAFERRSIGRTKIAKTALLFFIGQSGVRSLSEISQTSGPAFARKICQRCR